MLPGSMNIRGEVQSGHDLELGTEKQLGFVTRSRIVALKGGPLTRCLEKLL